MPKDYTVELSNIRNLKELESLNLLNKEGFVVNYKTGLKIKVLFPWFSKAHSLLNQAVVMQRRLFYIHQELKKHIGAPKNTLSNYSIWEKLKNGGTVDLIIKNIPDYHYNLGVENWVEECANNIISKLHSENGSNGQVQWDRVKPDQIDEFRVDHLMNLSESETIIWNRVNRIFEEFD